MSDFLRKIRLTPGQVIDIVLIVLLIIVIAQNLEGVRVRFLFFGFELPLAILLASIFVIGFFTSRAFFNNKQSGDDSPEDKK